MTYSARSLILSTLMIAAMTTACTDIVHTPAPDYAIRVMPSADGKTMVAIPPECPNRYDFSNGPWENQFDVQLGCATARNLAAQVANKEDLVKTKKLGAADGTFAAASIKNYRAGRSKPLINPWDDKPTAAAPTNAGETK